MSKTLHPLYPRDLPNWLIACETTRVNITLGIRLFTGHDKNDTAGEYVVSKIVQVDIDTVHVVCTRIRRPR